MAVFKDKKLGTYYAVYYIDGKQHWKRGFKTKAEAMKFETLAKYQEDHPDSIKFEPLVKEYREYTKDSVTYATYLRVGILFDRFIIPNFPNKRIADIKELDCLKFWQYLQKLEKSSGYKNDILGAFKGVFKYAENYRNLRRNPAIKLQRFQKTRDEKLKRKERDIRIWTHEEFRQFIDCVDNRIHKALFITLYYTGMRKGECLALTWNDLKDHVICVTKSLSRKTDLNSSYEIKEPKNVFSIRDISLNDGLYQYLLQFKEEESRLPGFSEDWYMFGRLDPIAENTLTRAKDRAVSRSGVKYISIHDFRHSHASNLIADGVNIVAVSKRLGHSDVSMTLSVYTHLLTKTDDALIKNLEENSRDLFKH